MRSKSDLEREAKSLIESEPEKSANLYREIRETYPNEFNHWDAANTIKALRKCAIPDLAFGQELARQFNQPPVANLYSWLIFDHCIKRVEIPKIRQYENLILECLKISGQKNRRSDDSYPCPITIGIFKLADAYSKNQLNASRVNDLMHLLNPDFLSISVESFQKPDGKTMEKASDLEKYYMLKTKALFKLGHFEECIQSCKEGLRNIQKYHYDNDLWFEMRMAICELNLGMLESGEERLKKLITTRSGSSKWILYKHISEAYYEQDDLNNALKYSIQGALLGNEPHFLLDLYMNQARILHRLNRTEEGKCLAVLIGASLKEQDWKFKADHSKMLAFYGIDINQLPSVKEAYGAAIAFWKSEKYKGLQRVKGKVIFIHKNDKVGKIETVHGETIGFHRNNFEKRVRTLSDLESAEVEFFVVEPLSGEKKQAEQIVVTSRKTSPDLPPDLVGKTLQGKIQNCSKYGVFVSLPKLPTGLIHKSTLPEDLKNSFEDKFHKGDSIDVRIERITPKGLQMSLIKHYASQR